MHPFSIGVLLTSLRPLDARAPPSSAPCVRESDSAALARSGATILSSAASHSANLLVNLTFQGFRTEILVKSYYIEIGHWKESEQPNIVIAIHFGLEIH